jgi:hypothetical protein
MYRGKRFYLWLIFFILVAFTTPDEYEYESDDYDDDDEEEEDSSFCPSGENENGDSCKTRPQDFGDLWHWLDCDTLFTEQRPVLHQATWNHMKNVYQDIIQQQQQEEEEEELSPTMILTETTTMNLATTSGFQVPVEVKQASVEKGRGVYASERIPKGSTVWLATQTIRFRQADHYRLFVASIQDELACDVMEWTYVMKTENDDGLVDVNQNAYNDAVEYNNDDEYTSSTRESDDNHHHDPSLYTICVDLDEGALVNGVFSDNDVANIKGVPDVVTSENKNEPTTTGKCNHKLVALRDIQPGEELVCDYDDWQDHIGWIVLGLSFYD